MHESLRIQLEIMEIRTSLCGNFYTIMSRVRTSMWDSAIWSTRKRWRSKINNRWVQVLFGLLWQRQNRQHCLHPNTRASRIPQIKLNHFGQLPILRNSLNQDLPFMNWKVLIASVTSSTTWSMKKNLFQDSTNLLAVETWIINVSVNQILAIWWRSRSLSDQYVRSHLKR